MELFCLQTLYSKFVWLVLKFAYGHTKLLLLFFFLTLIKYIGIEETYHSLGNHGKAGGGEDDDVSPVPEHRKSGLIEALEKRNPDYNATIRCSFFWAGTILFITLHAINTVIVF